MRSRDEIISGGAALDDLLRTLPNKMHKNINRSALAAGAAVMLQAVRANIPVDSGALRKSARVTSRIKGNLVYASVKVGNKKAWYAQLVEFGTRTHRIVARDDGGLLIGGRVVSAVTHPGAKPHPYARPAAESAFVPAVRAVASKIRQRLTEQGLNTPDTAPRDDEE